MSQHLKNIVMNGLRARCVTFVPLPPQPTPHSKGVRYFTLAAGIEILAGAMDTQKDGHKRRKRIIVRPSRHHLGLHELYTYHFPKHWSEACVSNRELIKEAQRQAHALEHDFSYEGLEWRIRFFSHYFRVFRCGEKPAPGLKAYSRFYQFAYVSIYRALKAAREAEQERAQHILEQVQNIADEVSFVPVLPARFRRRNYVRLMPSPALIPPNIFCPATVISTA